VVAPVQSLRPSSRLSTKHVLFFARGLMAIFIVYHDEGFILDPNRTHGSFSTRSVGNCSYTHWGGRLRWFWAHCSFLRVCAAPHFID